MNRSSSGLRELERHAIRLADRQISVTIHVTVSKGRRQRPDSARIVLCVLGIGIDLGLVDQFESGVLGGLDNIGLSHISGFDLLLQGSIGLGPVLDYTKRATGLQRIVER